jgi:predicted thioesterase
MVTKPREECAEPVRVTLHLSEGIPRLPREQRRRVLEDRFRALAASMPGAVCRIDFDTISVSGQTVEATVDAVSLPEIQEKLRHEHVRVDRVTRRYAEQ